MTQPPAPRRTAKPLGPVTIDGKLVPFYDNGQPVLLEMPGSDLLYLACFTSAEALRSVLERGAIAFDRIKQVNDGGEFLSSIPREIAVIVDPYWTERGTLRFTQVLRP